MWRKLHLLVSLVILASKIIKVESISTTTKTSSETSSKKTTLTPPVRVKNLDHWDDITLSTYLHINPKAPNIGESKKDDATTIPKETNDLPDAVIMFYAQWSQNSHSLAPLYDKIATLLNAGYADSNRIMALYDCERGTLSKQICQAAGVASYPTLMYVSQHTVFHDTDWFTSKLFGMKRSCGPMGCTKQSHTVKFQGDWRYGEEIYDWIIVMGGLSKWSKWSKSWKDSWNNRRKSGSKKLSAQPLPVGIPNSSSSGTSSTTSFSATTKPTSTGDEQVVTQLQSKLQEVQKKSKQYQDATKHAGLLIDSILFHGQTDSVTSKANQTLSDPFVIIHQGDLWNKFHMKLPKEESIILSCVMDLSVDYCTRHTLNKFKMNATKTTVSASSSSDNTTTTENTSVVLEEPYCNIIDNCLKNSFKPKECQPASCPFNNQLACKYVSSCLNSQVQEEYAVALGL